jgi:hypothetical protein
MIRRARHGFRREEVGFQHSFFPQRQICREPHAFLRGNRKEKAQVLTERKARPASRGQQFPQLGWRDEPDAEKRHAAIEQQPFDRVSVTAKRHGH